MSIYTGAIVGVCKLSTAGTTPAPLCRKFSGGSFQLNPNNSINEGGGGRDLTRKGTTEAVVSVTCCGLSSVDVALFFPTARAVQVASFPGLMIEVNDGNEGCVWVLTDGQPASYKASCSDGPDAQVEHTLEMKFATASTVAHDALAATYNAYKSHTVNDCSVSVAATSVGCLSWEISNDLGCEMHNPMDSAKTAGVKTLPDGYYITQSKPTISLVMSSLRYGATTALADEWTGENIIVALANGTTAENLTFTASTFVVNSAFEVPLGEKGRIGFKSDHKPDSGLQWGRIAVT
jgi:hypothetical protein